jgi:predicted CoA-substrate-specific enzyme activase
MYYSGCDLGAAAAKYVIINGNGLISYEINNYHTHPKTAAVDVMEKTLLKSRLNKDQIASTGATGCGKKIIYFTENKYPETTCLLKSVTMFNPEARTVIEIGGQSIRAFTITDSGRIRDSVTNEKCADGTGRFIDVMARALEVPVEETGAMAIASKNPIEISSQCGVFAESEVISHVNDGRESADIIAGICASIARRIASLAKKVNFECPLLLTGGVAKNPGVVYWTEKELGIKIIKNSIDPQIYTAAGAAIMSKS